MHTEREIKGVINFFFFLFYKKRPSMPMKSTISASIDRFLLRNWKNEMSTDNDHKHTLTFPSFMINRLEEFHPKIILVAVYWVDSSQCLAVKENGFKIELHYILLIEAWVNSIIKPCFNRASELRQIKFNCRKGIQLVMTYLIYSWQFLLLLVGAIFSILLKNTGEMGVINYWMYRQIIFPDDSLSRRYKITLSQS